MTTLRLILVAVLILLTFACASASTTGAPAAEFAILAADEDLDEGVYVRVVDVGPGLCTITRIPGPHYFVYDIGHWQGRKCIQAARQVIPGEDIDLLVISHSDSDHLGDGGRLLGEYRVHQIWRTGFRRSDTSSWKRLNRAIAREVQNESASVINLATLQLDPGHQVALGEATVTFMAGWPVWTDSGPTSSERRNAISIVIRLDYHDHSVLLSGDTVGRRLNDPDTACKDAEKVMVDRHGAGDIDLDVDIIVAPHHGGNNGSSTCFIEAVSPEFVVFSAGHDHQHPADGAATRYLTEGVSVDNIFRTDRSDDEDGPFEWKGGSIENCVDGRGDDDVEIRLPKAGDAEVAYRTPDGAC